jgi:hypothetical protein
MVFLLQLRRIIFSAQLTSMSNVLRVVFCMAFIEYTNHDTEPLLILFNDLFFVVSPMNTLDSRSPPVIML